MVVGQQLASSLRHSLEYAVHQSADFSELVDKAVSRVVMASVKGSFEQAVNQFIVFNFDLIS